MKIAGIRLLRWLSVVAALSGAVLAPAAGLRINELISSSGAGLADEDGDFSDWIELYNPGPQAVDLSGHGLTDDPKRPFKWRFEAGPVLAPNGFAVVFASGKDRQPGPANAVDPVSIPGLRLRFSADAISTNNPQQVRVGNGALWVKRWPNQGVNTNPANQTDPAAQPRYLPDAVNGRPALRFNGQTSGLRWAQPPATNDFTLLAVFRTSAGHERDPEAASGVGGTSGQHWLFGATHGGDLDGGAGVSVGTNGVSVYEHGSGYMPALAVSSGRTGAGWVVLSVTYAGKLPSIAVRGLPVRTGVRSPRRQVFAPTELGNGAYGAMAGEVAEVLCYDRALTPAERGGVEQFLAGKYGLAFDFPRHANFQLSAGGEQVVLTAPDGTRLDRIDFAALPRDISYGRQPDGSGPWLSFAQPTPGRSNATPGASEWLQPVQFQIPGGFYSNAIQLSLSVSNRDAAIRYTIDGAEPAETSPLYAQPLILNARTGAPNVVSLIPTAPGWQPPAGPVFKGWTVRARAFKPGALDLGAVTHSYFITPRGAARYSTPVVSLTTARANFFGPATGIYVPGITGANYSQRGTEWERPMFVEVFETNGVRVIAQEVSVSIHGNTSQGFPIKGLDLDAAGGPGRRPFAHRFFPGRERTVFNNLLLRPSGHDNYLAFQRDELMQDLMGGTGAESQAARLSVVFLNGEYWGLHYLKEKEDIQFIENHSGLGPGEFDFLEGYAGAKAGDTAAWEELLQLLTRNAPALASTYAEVRRRVDVQNYMDYKAAEIFTYRWDIGNHRLWRPRTPEGRFRWLQFDNDVGWGGFWAVAPAWNFNMLQADLETTGSLNGHNSETTTFLLRKLVENRDFRSDFITRFCDLLNSVYLPANTLARIDAFSRVLEPEMAEHALRWRAPASLAEWRGNVQAMRDFANRRPAAMRNHLRTKFNLGGNVSLRAAASGGGSGVVRVNTLTIDARDSAPWTGIYFQNHPLVCTAEPSAGHRFVRWLERPDAAGNRLELRPASDLTLTAVFEPTPIQFRSRRTAGVVVLEIEAAAGTTYQLERSADLAAWSLERSVRTDDRGAGQATLLPTADRAWFRLRLPGPL